MIDFTSTPIILTVILGAIGVILPVINVIRKEKGSSSFYGAITFGALITAIGFVVYQIMADKVTPAAIFSENVLVDDMFGSFFAIAMLIVSIMTTVGSFNYMRGKAHPAVYYSLILLASVGMVLIAYSTDLVMLLVAWELMSIPTYVLAGFMKKDPTSNEAALKYFLFGALSSAIIIYGISIAYGLTGSTNIAQVISEFSHLGPDMMPLALLSVAMFIAGFGFKMGLVPFHMWLPDAYEGAPTTISALLAAGTKKAGFAAALRVIVMGTVALNLEWTFALGIIAVMTMTVGNIAAIMQKNITRMLAYSSIAHAGYILIGLSIAPFSQIGIQAALFHILNHAVMKGAAFIAAAGIITTLEGSQTLACRPKFSWKTPIVPGPHTSWVIKTSTLTQMLSPGEISCFPALRARIFSVIVIVIAHPFCRAHSFIRVLDEGVENQGRIVAAVLLQCRLGFVSHPVDIVGYKEIDDLGIKLGTLLTP